MYKVEIDKLYDILNEAKVPCKIYPCYEGWQLRVGFKDSYGQIENFNMDAVCHGFSYGQEQGLLEIKGGLTEEENEEDSILGYLTAEEVAKRFIWCWERNTNVYKEE